MRCSFGLQQAPQVDAFLAWHTAEELGLISQIQCSNRRAKEGMLFRHMLAKLIHSVDLGSHMDLSSSLEHRPHGTPAATMLVGGRWSEEMCVNGSHATVSGIQYF